MRSVHYRLAALAGAIAIILSCDSGSPTEPVAFGGTPAGSGTGGTTTGKGGTDITKPTVTIDTPSTGLLVNTGDSILIVAKLHDDKALAGVELTGLTYKGSAALGTLVKTVRYGRVLAPSGGDIFRAGLRDTVVRRYLKPAVPVDTSLDSLVIQAVVFDSAGNTDTVLKRVNIVAGPRVTLLSPAAGDSVPAGVGLSINARATSNEGVASLIIHVVGESNWPTKLDTTLKSAFTGANTREVNVSGTVRVPLDAPIRGRITVTTEAMDINRQPGATAPLVVIVRSGSSAQPRVTQEVLSRSEITDSVIVSAAGDGIRIVGFVVSDSAGRLIRRDSVFLSQPYVSNARVQLPLNLSTTDQGRRVQISTFAYDQSGRIGFSVKPGTGAAQGSAALAFADSSLIVYGRTFKLPRNGIIGDVAVDTKRGNIFLSNINLNRLEIFQNSVQKFDSLGVSVGSLPWGMFIGNSPDTLLVANSGATTISRVFLGTTGSPREVVEPLDRRIRTRNTYVYQITVAKDDKTGKISLTAAGPFSYSDRPQYVAQSAGGRVFYSTRPTTTAPAGTIRWLDPSLPVPDPRQIWQYGTILQNTTTVIYTLFNVDSIGIGATLPSSLNSDTLFIFDHPYGQASGSVAVFDTIPVGAVAKANAGGSDAELVYRLDLLSLDLKDTTFVASAGDRSWVGFGEGNTKSLAGRVVLVNDPDPSLVAPPFFSPQVTTRDLMDNASEQVFGLAIDSVGLQVASHGQQTYNSAIDNPFHLRLDGKYDSFDNGAGIAFHPGARGTLTPEAERVAFVAAQSGQIEIMDVAHYVNRGRLQLKAPIYGPLRASRRLPGDPANVVLKLFALTQNGLIVIDLTAQDIKPSP